MLFIKRLCVINGQCLNWGKNDSEIDNMECETNTVENDKVSSSGSISSEHEVYNTECKQKHMDSHYQTRTYSETVLKGDD